MVDRSYLSWPFFEAAHRDWGARVETVARGLKVDHGDTDAACRALVADLGVAGILAPTASEDGRFDLRALCLARETLARHDGLADFAFAMQGLGTGAITLFGTPAQKARWLPETRAGRAIAAFALTEPGSGSDVANGTMRARRDGADWVLDGEKTWISNGGIADVYTLFARSGEAPGAKGLSAFLVTPDLPGFEVVERLETIAPHPLARLRLTGCRVPGSALLGAPGGGFGIAMSVLDVFRTTVAAAALGFARRALDAALDRVTTRRIAERPLADLQMVQAHLAQMALDVDASALLVYRAAWARDALEAAGGGAPRITREAAMAKLFATDQAQQVIDSAVQLFGGEGVRAGSVVERLYREIRALRIYEGASDVQKIIIARQALAAHQGGT
jgi:acyl-CoA dehydrogenase